MARRTTVERKMSRSEKAICAIAAAVVFSNLEDDDEDAIVDAVDIAEKIMGEIDTRYVGGWE